jgi:RimJ/RimL family protein N-acetyltransferase
MVARYQGWSPMTEQAALAFLSKESKFTDLMPGEWSQVGVAKTASNQLVGDVGVWLSPDSSTAEFGISLARHVQGQGLGANVIHGLIQLIFASTTVGEVIANTDQRNEPCIRALRRAGMSQIGARTETYKGKLCTELCFLADRPVG